MLWNNHYQIPDGNALQTALCRILLNIELQVHKLNLYKWKF